MFINSHSGVVKAINQSVHGRKLEIYDLCSNTWACHKLDDFINKFFSQQGLLPVAQGMAGFLQLLGDPLPEWSQTKWNPFLVHSLTSDSSSGMFPGVIKPLVPEPVLISLFWPHHVPDLVPLLSLHSYVCLYLPLPLLFPVPTPSLSGLARLFP